MTSVAVLSDAAALTPTERRVARALLANYPQAGLGRASDLAKAAGVSAPTVVRFARRLGFSGYADLQAALLSELSERQISPIAQLVQRRNLGEKHWVQDGLGVVEDAVRSSILSLPLAELDAAVALLADPSLRVSFIGGRYSQLLADYAYLHLQQIRPGVRPRLERLELGTSITIDVGRRDLFLVYDFRRYQASTVVVAEALAGAGARIICVTDKWMSPVAKFAEVVLPVSVESPGPFDSMAAGFVLTELLVDQVLTLLGPRAHERMRRWEAAGSSEVL